MWGASGEAAPADGCEVSRICRPGARVSFAMTLASSLRDDYSANATCANFAAYARNGYSTRARGAACQARRRLPYGRNALEQKVARVLRM
jgi:hypothetical protein